MKKIKYRSVTTDDLLLAEQVRNRQPGAGPKPTKPVEEIPEPGAEKDSPSLSAA